MPHGPFCSEKCTRFNNGARTPCLSGAGPKPARIMIVSECPGQKEDALGTPFGGASERTVNELLAAVGIDRSQVYVTNAVKCGTPIENVAPTKKEIKICKQYLVGEINEVNPEIIVTLGAKALEAVLNRTGIATINNNVFMSEEFNVRVLPIYHPAFGLRNPGVLPAIKRGFELLASELRGQSKPVDKTSFFIAKNEEDVNKILSKLERVSQFAFDFETSGLDYRTCKIISAAFTWSVGSAAVIPWTLHTEKTLSRLSKIFATDNISKIAHNVKFEMNVCKANGMPLAYPIEDTMLMHHLLDENSKHGLDTLTLRYTNMGEYWKDLDEYKDKYCKDHSLSKDDFSYDKIPPEILYPYNGRDTDATLRSFLMFKTRLENQKLTKIYYEYVLPFTAIIAEMEYRGIAVDREKLADLIVEYTKKKEELEISVYVDPAVVAYEQLRKDQVKEELRKKFDESKILKSRYGDFEAYAVNALKEKEYKFNMSSPKQLGELFFTLPKRAPIKTTDKGGISVDEEVLEALDKLGVSAAKVMLEYRRLLKYLSTYLVSTYEKSAKDGRIHGEFLQHGTVTGRLSSRNPNLQNLPRDAKDFKKCLVADPGYTFVKADLAQAEFRCWATYAEDEDMIADIHSGLDIHKRTASEVFGVPVSDIKKDDPRRTAAKNCVTGDTWVPTNKGLVQIKDIKVGDIVLDHLNREQEVLETIIKEDDVYLLETECGAVKCTKNHPFYILDSDCNFIPVELDKLSINDYILACTSENRTNNYVKWAYSGNRVTSFSKIKDIWILDEEVGFLLGFILAEGSISHYSTTYEVRWSQKGKYVEYIDYLSNKIFGDRVKKRIDPRTGVVSWLVTSLEFFSFCLFTGMCYNNKKGLKNFPYKIFESPTAVQREFLRGYFMGDGTFKKDRICVGSVSKDLCYGVCFLLQLNGIYPKISNEQPKGGRKFYNIQITNIDELAIVINNIKFLPPEGWEYPKQDRGRKFLFGIKDFYFKNHKSGDTRYHIKLRKNLTTKFLSKYCRGVSSIVDTLIDHNIYSVGIKEITACGKETVYDFVTTGDKIMVCNNLISLDCTFGLMYGRGSAAIAAQYNISQEQAEEIKATFFSRYPKARDWLFRQKKFVRVHGYVSSALGRYRRLPEISSDDKGVVAEAERQATNSPIQSLASDCNNHYMTMTIKRARATGIDCYPVASVHDANFILVKDDQVSVLIEIMRDVVKTEFPEFKCKMALDIELGKNFGEFVPAK